MSRQRHVMASIFFVRASRQLTNLLPKTETCRTAADTQPVLMERGKENGARGPLQRKLPDYRDQSNAQNCPLQLSFSTDRGPLSRSSPGDAVFCALCAGDGARAGGPAAAGEGGAGGAAVPGPTLRTPVQPVPVLPTERPAEQSADMPTGAERGAALQGLRTQPRRAPLGAG